MGSQTSANHILSFTAIAKHVLDTFSLLHAKHLICYDISFYMQKESEINILGVLKIGNEPKAKIPTSNHFYFIKVYTVISISHSSQLRL